MAARAVFRGEDQEYGRGIAVATEQGPASRIVAWKCGQDGAAIDDKARRVLVGRSHELTCCAVTRGKFISRSGVSAGRRDSLHAGVRALRRAFEASTSPDVGSLAG